MEVDAHARPPEYVRAVHRAHQKRSDAIDNVRLRIFDCEQGEHAGFENTDRAEAALGFDLKMLKQAFEVFTNCPFSDIRLPKVYEHPQALGLFVFPALLPPTVQQVLLNRLLHRDLSDPAHKTNLHPHYTIPYPNPGTSFFALPHPTTFPPLDPTVHKPLSLPTVLNKKLRWMTLGGQYDWTAKQYPSTAPPRFPPDTAALVNSIFKQIAPQAAICNVYSPGDQLAPHRDVSEECHRPLVSISLGCDALFVVAPSGEDGRSDRGDAVVTLRLRSGDVVVMAGEARTAWHSVPRIEAGTCPGYLADWPVVGDTGDVDFGPWKGWMAGKRVNLNIRQMWES